MNTCFIEDLKLSGEQELVQFLSEEIAAECKAQKIKSVPSKIDGFDVKLDGAEVTLTKKAGNET
jgi:complement component 1 Q subcomponent-binding protein